MLLELSSASRRLTGTSAISDFFGSRSRSCRNWRNAPLHIAITTSLSVPPICLPSVLSSATGTERLPNERWLVTDALKIVFGAVFTPRLRLRGVFLRVRMNCSAVPPIALAACGTIFPSFRYCATELEMAACSSSATPSW